ncbi:MAG: prolipoprotein diacylglyceryl transferase [Anaerolineales bacterium]|nr:prolipoprotein diacylglyceryl transferase [Anaerolineales bacterium]
MFPILQLGPLALRTPGLLLLLGLYLGLSLAERRLPRRGAPDANQLYNLFLIAVGVGLVTARLAFIVQNPALFRGSWLNWLALDARLLDPWTGITLGLLAALVYGQRKRLSFWETLDAFTPVAATLAVFLGLAHLASGNAYGLPTSLPWGIELWGAKRHPTQIYEILLALGMLAWLWPRFQQETRPGTLFARFLTAYAAATLFIHAWRADSTLVTGGFRLEQILAWLAMALGFWLWARLEQGEQTQSYG